MRLRDLRTGLRLHLTIVTEEEAETWGKGPGHYVGIREVLRDFMRVVREHETRLGELTEIVEGQEGHE